MNVPTTSTKDDRLRVDPRVDSQLVWWPWGPASEGPRRLRRPWRAVTLVLLQGLLFYGVFELTRVWPTLQQADEAAPIVTREDLESLRDRTLLVPVVGVERGQLRGSFGAPRGLRKHKGIDIVAPRHRPVVAVEDGRVVRLASGRLSGLAVHHMSPDGRYVYFYAHLEAYAEDLEEGERVRAGDVIGYVGSTGNARTPHLHFAIRHLDERGRPGAGEAIDPFHVLRLQD